MPLNGDIPVSKESIPLEEIRKYYFERTKRTLRIEDAKYLQERASELGISSGNGGLNALFKTLKYDLGE